MPAKSDTKTIWSDMSPAHSRHLISAPSHHPHHQLSMDVKAQVHKIYVQLLFSKTSSKVILPPRGAKGLRAPSPPLTKAGALTSAVWQQPIALERDSPLRNVWDKSDTLWPAS